MHLLLGQRHSFLQAEKILVACIKQDLRLMICMLLCEILKFMRIERSFVNTVFLSFLSYCATSAEIKPLKPAAVWHIALSATPGNYFI